MHLTLALDRYDRHFPFFDGTVQAPDGFKLRAAGWTVTSAGRQRRSSRGMLAGKYDVAECR